MPTPTDGTVPLTGIAFIDGLTWGASWVFPGPDHVLTYSFSQWPDFTGGTWTPAWQSAMNGALQTWANVADLRFVESGSGTFVNQSTADLAFAQSSDVGDFLGAAALGFPPSPEFVDQLINRPVYPKAEGDIWFDQVWPGFSSLSPGSQGFEVMVHELGHALGLKHSFDEDGGSRPTFAKLGLSQYENQDWTVMSYTPGAGGIDNLTHAATPMVLDILAIQHIYGPNMTYHTGDDTYVLLDTGIKQAIWDAGGTDTLDASRLSNGINIDLNAGSLMPFGVHGNDIAIAFNVTIENAIGTPYADHLIGNDADNLLRGNGGDDALDGRTGVDQMFGGAGNDTYYVETPGDMVTEFPGQGSDLVHASISYTLPDNVEKLELTGGGDINGTGNALDNVLSGNDGANILAGGSGNDTYIADDPKDSIIEHPGEGVDLVLSSLAFSVLPNNVENVTLTGAGDGQVVGNDLSNVLVGNGGNNVLDGGRGADSMAGGAGDDTYKVDFALDQVTELAGVQTGTDTIVTQVPQLLGPNIENLILGESGGNIEGVGNAADNVMVGNNSANLLDGGAGNDTLMGQGGDDTLLGGVGTDTLSGGLGRDVLSGGSGADYFVFDSSISSGTNVDQIVDFVKGQDVIDLSAAIFTVLGTGDPGAAATNAAHQIGNFVSGPDAISLLTKISTPGGAVAATALADSEFVSGPGAVAHDANQHVIHDTSTGMLYYDADGNGAQQMIAFAQVVAGQTLAHSDFHLIA
jgi:serralysin